MAATRIALVCEGDASRSENVFSGTAKRMYYALQDRGHHMVAVDASLTGLSRAAAAAISLSSDRNVWRSKFRYGNATNRLRAAAAAASLGNQPVDVVLQIGATFDPPGAAIIPYTIFADWNMALSIQEAESKVSSKGLDVAALKAIDREHRRRYLGAAVVFTISERLRQSFLNLYGLPADRVITAYAGPNFDSSAITRALQKPRHTSAPAVLFIAKEFQRKGGDTVAAAFARIQSALPEARLLFAGARQLPVEFQGLRNVEHLGLLDKSNPQQLDRLLAAYRDADVLVLPSRRDPFPTVIREAMFLGLPCVVSDIWAMPEMVVDRQTGFLISPGDTEALAARCLELMTDRGLNDRLGAAARVRAEDFFSWQAVGAALEKGLQSLDQGKRGQARTTVL